jgi:hypothetical protein
LNPETSSRAGKPPGRFAARLGGPSERTICLNPFARESAVLRKRIARTIRRGFTSGTSLPKLA